MDRQQGRIRNLIEEQVAKVDEERSVTERRCQEQLRQLRDDINAQEGEVGRMTAEVERAQRLEAELRRQLQV